MGFPEFGVFFADLSGVVGFEMLFIGSYREMRWEDVCKDVIVSLFCATHLCTFGRIIF